MDKELFELPSPKSVANTPCEEHTQKAPIGKVKVDGKTRPLHRHVFCINRGIPYEDISNLDVLKACQNKRCINPLHMFLWPSCMANPFGLSTGYKEGRQLLSERKKTNPQTYLYWEYRNYPDKDYVK